MADFSVLLGKTLARIEGAERGSDRIVISTTTGERFVMWHRQDCCESVEVEDVCGDVADLIGSPILSAEEVTHENEDPPGVTVEDMYRESFTWTFYKLATIKGSVTIRWLGESNGYYSESVDFEEAA